MKLFDIFREVKEIQQNIDDDVDNEDVNVEWRFRSFDLEFFQVNDSVELFLNACSREGFKRITIKNFPNRTTIFATRITKNSPPDRERRINDLHQKTT